MKVIRFSSLAYQPASHEDQQKPGVLKKILLTYKDLATGRVQMINWAKLPPKKFFRPHYHEDMEEIFIILTGKAKLTLDKQTAMLHKGDVVVIPRKITHKMTNIGKGGVTYIAIGITQKGIGKTIVVK